MKIREVTISSRKKRRDNPRKKVILADAATIADVLGQRPEPEFKNREYVRGRASESDDQLNNILRCDEPNCGASFTKQISLTNHKHKHLVRTIRCDWCGQTFRTTQDLQEHQEEFHFDINKYPEANPLQCRKCLKISRDKKALWRHVRETHRNEKSICPQCNMEFAQPHNLTEHLRTIHASEKQMHSCPICTAKYAQLNSLRTHIRSKHRGGPSKTFTCVICKTVYTDLHSYRNHMKQHVNPKFFPCQLCNLKFRSNSHLLRHKRSAQHKSAERKAEKKGWKINQFDQSSEAATTTDTSKGRAYKNLSTIELINQCKLKVAKILLRRVDEHVFKNSSSAKLNTTGISKNKTPEKKLADRNQYYLKCLYCDSSHSTLDGVKAHEVLCYQKIRNLKLHICHVCDKEYTNKQQLERHLRTHSEERRFKCAYCEQMFKSETTKVLHEKAVHFGIRHKPATSRIFACNYDGCGKQFKGGLKTLREHVATIHLGIRYPCNECGKLFMRESAMRRHFIEEHTNIPTEFFCEPCNKKYKGRVLFRIHLRRPMHARRVQAANAAQSSLKIVKVTSLNK